MMEMITTNDDNFDTMFESLNGVLQPVVSHEVIVAILKQQTIMIKTMNEEIFKLKSHRNAYDEDNSNDDECNEHDVPISKNLRQEIINTNSKLNIYQLEMNELKNSITNLYINNTNSNNSSNSRSSKKSFKMNTSRSSLKFKSMKEVSMIDEATGDDIDINNNTNENYDNAQTNNDNDILIHKENDDDDDDDELIQMHKYFENHIATLQSSMDDIKLKMENMLSLDISVLFTGNNSSYSSSSNSNSSYSNSNSSNISNNTNNNSNTNDIPLDSNTTTTTATNDDTASGVTIKTMPDDIVTPNNSHTDDNNNNNNNNNTSNSSSSSSYSSGHTPSLPSKRRNSKSFGRINSSARSSSSSSASPSAANSSYDLFSSSSFSSSSAPPKTLHELLSFLYTSLISTSNSMQHKITGHEVQINDTNKSLLLLQEDQQKGNDSIQLLATEFENYRKKHDYDGDKLKGMIMTMDDFKHQLLSQKHELDTKSNTIDMTLLIAKKHEESIEYFKDCFRQQVDIDDDLKKDIKELFSLNHKLTSLKADRHEILTVQETAVRTEAALTKLGFYNTQDKQKEYYSRLESDALMEMKLNKSDFEHLARLLLSASMNASSSSSSSSSQSKTSRKSLNRLAAAAGINMSNNNNNNGSINNSNKDMMFNHTRPNTMNSYNTNSNNNSYNNSNSFPLSLSQPMSPSQSSLAPLVYTQTAFSLASSYSNANTGVSGRESKSLTPAEGGITPRTLLSATTAMMNKSRFSLDSYPNSVTPSLASLIDTGTSGMSGSKARSAVARSLDTMHSISTNSSNNTIRTIQFADSNGGSITSHSVTSAGGGGERGGERGGGERGGERGGGINTAGTASDDIESNFHSYLKFKKANPHVKLQSLNQSTTSTTNTNKNTNRNNSSNNKNSNDDDINTGNSKDVIDIDANASIVNNNNNNNNNNINFANFSSSINDNNNDDDDDDDDVHGNTATLRKHNSKSSSSSLQLLDEMTDSIYSDTTHQSQQQQLLLSSSPQNTYGHKYTHPHTTPSSSSSSSSSINNMNGNFLEMKSVPFGLMPITNYLPPKSNAKVKGKDGNYYYCDPADVVKTSDSNSSIHGSTNNSKEIIDVAGDGLPIITAVLSSSSSS